MHSLAIIGGLILFVLVCYYPKEAGIIALALIILITSAFIHPIAFLVMLIVTCLIIIMTLLDMR